MTIEEAMFKVKMWNLNNAIEDFKCDVYSILDFLPTSNEANQIIDSFEKVINEVNLIIDGKRKNERLKKIIKRTYEEEEFIDGKHLV